MLLASSISPGSEVDGKTSLRGAPVWKDPGPVLDQLAQPSLVVLWQRTVRNVAYVHLDNLNVNHFNRDLERRLGKLPSQ